MPVASKIRQFVGLLHPAGLMRHQVTSTPMRGMNPDTKARLLGLMALGSIAVWLTLSIGNAFYFSLISLRWPKVQAHIVSSRIDTGTSTVGTWWSPDVVYEYDLSGREYRSTTIRYVMPPAYEIGEAQTVLAAYPLNAKTSAAYDPRNPARSVLEPGIPHSMWLKGLIPLFFWCLTAYLYYEIMHPERRLMLRSNPEVVGQE